MISTRRRLEFAAGYLELGMTTEAAEEIEAIEGTARLSAEVMRVRADLHMQAKQWDLLHAVSRELMRQRPEDEKGWVYTAYALRELERIVEAKAVLIEAEARHGQACAVLHYNLACYHCLLGEIPAAKTRLAIACRMDGAWRAAALEDPDLRAMWNEIAAMP
ncbi:MAG: repeat-containing protein [Verrucomicrobia bacterium]|nr:repeat-containing protein [Verrucomicrobiota bacterium]